MTINQAYASPRKPLRLWPAVVFAILQLVSWFIVPRVSAEFGAAGFFGSLLFALLIVLWWLFASRAPWLERLGVLALMVVAVLLTRQIIHISMSNAGMGMMFYFLSPLLMSFALVVGLMISRTFSDKARRVVTCAAVVLACGAFALIRTGGVYAGVNALDFHWRWSQTPEERMLAAAEKDPTPPPPAAAVSTPTPATVEPSREASVARPADKSAAPATPPVAVAKTAEWPGFRGPHRDSVVPAVQIKTDWSASPPAEMWRRPVGPGWSSFAISGDHFFTQEQRGEHEVVACYHMKNGQPVWRHRDPVRFWESNGGAGPRGTPTLSGGRVYAFGATGILNVLDAGNGAVVWSRNVSKDTGKKVPYWGFSSSPIVVGDAVVVAAGGQLAAYDAASGNPRWTGPDRSGTYSSPHLLTIDGVEQILLLTGTGTVSLSPADGKLLWEHKWEAGGATVIQPARMENGDILLSASSMAGGEAIRRVSVSQEGGAWTIKERWTSPGLKPYFNDFVVHKGHAYGFDGAILSCINLENGERKWKGGRYGNGQMVLLAAQDLLLVISEEGELALVSAKPDQFTELAKMPAVEGKTWNHPAVVGDVLLVRNDREMVAFRLPLANR